MRIAATVAIAFGWIFSDTWNAKGTLSFGSPADADTATFNKQGQNATFETDLFTEVSKITASDGSALDHFGFSVAISGDYAIVGANRDDDYRGAAYIFVRNGSSWSQQQKLIASDGAVEDNFGWSVAINGDTAVVGAYLDDAPGADQGSAYVFVRTGSTWTQQQKLTGGTAGDQFGISVAISSDTSLVGAFGDSTYRGAAYVFTRSGSTWTEQQKLTASDGVANDDFGWSVSLDGDSAVVGSPRDDSSRGSVFAFVRSGGIWTQQQKLTAGDGTSLDQFGSSVEIDGASIIAGAVNDESGGSVVGSAYIFTRSGSFWSEQQKLSALNGTAGDQFGASVSISGNVAIVGSSGDDNGSVSDAGSAVIFVRAGSSWSQTQILTASDGSEGDSFGSNVSLDGRYTIVGSFLDDPSGSESGSSYIFDDPTGTGPTPTPTPTPVGIEGDVAKRVNGDGDLLINDLIQLRRFIVGSDTLSAATNEFQRADIAPIETFGDGTLDANDIVQSRRDILRLDAPRSASGPLQPTSQMRWLSVESYKPTFGRALLIPRLVASAGDTVSVPIEINALGDEFAISFTIEFDPMILSDPDVVLSEAFDGTAALTVNLDEAKDGRIAVLIDSAQPVKVDRGKTVVAFTFNTSAGTSILKFTDGLAERRVSDGNGRSVPVHFVDGMITVNKSDPRK